MTHIRPASFTGPSVLQFVPLETFLRDMRNDLDSDFVDWSLFRATGDFTADSARPP